MLVTVQVKFNIIQFKFINYLFHKVIETINKPIQINSQTSQYKFQIDF